MSDLFTPHYSNNDTILNSFSGSSSSLAISSRRYDLSGVYNAGSTVINFWSGQINNYIYALRAYNTPINYVKIVRKNYVTNLESEISCIEHYWSILDYVVINENIGLLFVDEGRSISPTGNLFVYLIDWENLTCTLRNTYPYSYSATTYQLNKLIGVCRISNNVRNTFYFNKKIGSYWQGELLIYDYNLDTFSSLITCPSTSYSYYYTSSNSNDRYSDLGNGYMGFLLDVNRFICVLDTAGTLYSYELPSSVHSPLQVGDYTYITQATTGTNKYVAVAPNYTDNSFYILCTYKEVITGTAYDWFTKLLKMDTSGTVVALNQFGSLATEYTNPISLSASKDRIIATYYFSDPSTDEHVYYDVTNSVELFRTSDLNDLTISPSLDDTDNNLIWIRETPENDYEYEYIDSGSAILWGSNSEINFYQNGWDWTGWNAGYPSVSYGSLDGHNGMLLQGFSGSRSFTTGSLLWTQGIDAKSTTGCVVNITTGSDALRMVTVTNYFTDNILTPSYSTGFNMKISPSDWLAVYPGWGATSWGGDSATLETGYLFNMDLQGTPVSTPAGTLHTARAYVSGSEIITVNQGDRLDWSADNDGILNFEVYDVNSNYMELGWGIQINRTAKVGCVITASIYVKKDTDYIPHKMFGRLYYSDGTTVEKSISLPISSDFVTLTFTIPSNKHNLFLEKIVIGRYIDSVSLYANSPDGYFISMVITSLTMTLGNSSMLFKVDLLGNETELYDLGGDGYSTAYGSNVRLVASTVNHMDKNEHEFIIHYLTDVITQQMNAIMW